MVKVRSEVNLTFYVKRAHTVDTGKQTGNQQSIQPNSKQDFQQFGSNCRSNHVPTRRKLNARLQKLFQLTSTLLGVHNDRLRANIRSKCTKQCKCMFQFLNMFICFTRLTINQSHYGNTLALDK